MAEAPRTAVASEALRVGSSLMVAFKDYRIGATVQKALRVMDPEQSTQGGKLARQPIALVGTGGEAMSLVIGWMDVAAKQARFKGFEEVAGAFAQRSGMQVDFTAPEYDQLVASVVSFLQGQGIAAERAAPRQTVAPAQPMQAAAQPAPQSANLGLAIMFGGIGIAVGFGLGYLVFGM